MTIKTLIAQLKSVSGLITSIGVIAGGALWINSTANSNSSEQSDNFDRLFDSVAVINQNVEYLSIENSSQDEKLQNILDTLEDFDTEQKAHGDKIQSLAWGLNHINQFTPDDFEEIMDEMLKKKELVRIYPEWPEELTVHPTTSLRSMR